MKTIYLITFLLVTNGLYSQSIGIRMAKHTKGMSFSLPVKTLSGTNADSRLLCMILDDEDRHITSLQYVENLITYKKFNVYAGAGVHAGIRYVLNWKQDGNTIFLMGPTAIAGVKYTPVKALSFSADINPRTDFPWFGGCYMHPHCSESYLGNINLSLQINLK